MICEGSQSQSSDTKELETTEHAKDLKDQNLHIFVGVRRSNLDEAKYDAWSVCTSSHKHLQLRRKRTLETKEERWRRGWMDAMHIPSPSTQQELWQHYPQSPTHWLLMRRLVQWQLPLWSCFHRALAPPEQHPDAATDSSVLHLVSTNPETLPPQPCNFFGFWLSALQDFSSMVFPQKATVFGIQLFKLFLQDFFQNPQFFIQLFKFFFKAFSKTYSLHSTLLWAFLQGLFPKPLVLNSALLQDFLQGFSKTCSFAFSSSSRLYSSLCKTFPCLLPIWWSHKPHKKQICSSSSNLSLPLQIQGFRGLMHLLLLLLLSCWNAGPSSWLEEAETDAPISQSPNPPKQAYLETPLRTRLSDKAFLSSTHTQTWELCSWVALFRGIPE